MIQPLNLEPKVLIHLDWIGDKSHVDWYLIFVEKKCILRDRADYPLPGKIR